MKRLALDQAPASQWSGGSSHELLVLPAGAAYAKRDFDYRISVARIETPGAPFTALPGYTRYITGLDGPMALSVNGEAVALWAGQVHQFEGEDQVYSNSSGRDFNLMLRRGLPGRLYWAQGELQGPLYVFDPQEDAFYVLSSGESAIFGRVVVVDLTPLTLPPKIQNFVEGMQVENVGSGLSQARVLRFSKGEDIYYLKSQPGSALEDETAMLAWLQGKLPVPELLYAQDGHLLMRAVRGQPAFSDDLPRLLEALFDGLGQLRTVPLAGCPRDWTIRRQLQAAELRLVNNQVDPRVQDPWGIYKFLVDNQPEEEPCFSHGDYCLPNVFIEGNRAVGLIDLGKAGMGSPWNDLAICYRSFRKNYPQASQDLFASVWGQPIDWDLINYYILLDELA